MMPASQQHNFKGIKIYRWIKMNIRSHNYQKVEYPELENFFENRKEQEPYIVVGIGEKDSIEAKFLAEFSKIPSSPFKFYILEDKAAKRVF